MPIPMDAMDPIASGVFYYPSPLNDGEEYDGMLLCVCPLSGYLIAIPIPKPHHEDKHEGLIQEKAASLVMERWVDRFRVLDEMCSNRDPQSVTRRNQ